MKGAAVAAVLLVVPAAPQQYTVATTPAAQTVIAGRWATFHAHVAAGGQPAAQVKVDWTVVGQGQVASSWTDAAGDADLELSQDRGVTEQVQASVGEDRAAPVTVTWLPAATVALALVGPAYAGYPATLRATVTVPDGGVLPGTVEFKGAASGSVPVTADGPGAGHADFQYTSFALTRDSVTAEVEDSACVTDQAAVTVDWQTPFVLVLAPGDQHVQTGRTATITATVGNAATGTRYTGGGTVAFNVLTGPNAGRGGNAALQPDGTAAFGYRSTALGADTVRTSWTDPLGIEHLTDATVEWTAPPITVTGRELRVLPLLAVRRPVATFTVPDPTVTADRYTATIDWGDGTPAAEGRVSGSGPFAVSGSHRYRAEGDYPVTVTVTDTADPSNKGTGAGEVTASWLPPQPAATAPSGPGSP
ncbi:hypothetical protein ACFYNO_20500 [Kitasatospora sp. NPDC006697]|uniref:hypothetical protein n=1 Tax=Kitasatospora sp. NPDC006697 TaxID=3364020 RepID=UPI00367C7ACC